ncbi:MAG: ABC transporter substrate-binding protein [Solirubrobacterales bacterium]
MRIANLRAPLAVAAVALAATAIAACGSDNSDSGTSTSDTASITATKDAAIAEQVPAKYRDAGSLSVASDASYPPMEFIKEGTNEIIGADPDLATALGQVMGVKLDLSNVPFDSILAGIEADKYDLGMSSFTDTKEREQQVDFVTYLTAGTSFFEKASAPSGVKTLADLCGKKVAVQKGTTQADDAEAQSKKCVQGGKPKVDLLVFPDQNGANNALISGRAQVGMADSPVAAYQVQKTKGELKLTGEDYGEAPYGIAVPKDSGLAEPILAALKKLIDGGQYEAILKKWGLENGAISDPQINGAID